MKIGRISAFTGARHTMELNIDPKAYDLWARGEGPLIQDAFPNLTAGEREFLMTGVTPAEWANLFGAEQEEDKEYVTDEYSGEYDDEVGPSDGYD